MAGAWTGRVFRARGAGGEVCDVSRVTYERTRLFGYFVTQLFLLVVLVLLADYVSADFNARLATVPPGPKVTSEH